MEGFKTGFRVLLAGVIVGLWLLSAASAQGNITITVITPNGGECLIPGSEVDVTWTGEGFQHVAITHRTDNTAPPTYQENPGAWNPNHPVFGSTFRWQVPNITSTTVTLWIEAHDGNHAKLTADSSNNPFTISNSCGVGEQPTPTAPQVGQIVVKDRSFSPAETIQVEKGTNLTLAGTAEANKEFTLYVQSEEKKFTLKADGEGKWSFDVFTSNLEEGTHQVDLESADIPRTKAFSFQVIAVGSTVTPTPTQSPTASTATAVGSSISRTLSPFPLLWAGIAAGSLLLVGALTYFLLKRRSRRVDAAPSEQPPQIA